MKWARLVFAGALCFAVTASASAATINPLPGWAKAEHLDKALEVAKDKGRPIVFLYAFKTSSCPLHNGRARSYMREKSLKGMVKMLVYCDEQPPKALVRVLRQVDEPDQFVPRMYIADPELRILGFVKYKAGKNLRPIVALAKGTMSWLKKCRKNIEKADKLAEGGRYRAADKIYKDIVKNDLKRTVMVHKTWEHAADEGTVEGLYFPDVKEKRQELKDLARLRYEKAQNHYNLKEYAEARKLLEPMVADKSDLEYVKKAAELLKKVKEAEKVSRDKAKPKVPKTE